MTDLADRDIPEDVMHAARKIIDAEFADNGDRPIWGPPDQFVDLFARAIIAERERCAKVAETRHERWRMPHPAVANPGEVCDDITACADIAAAIRKGLQP